MDTSHRFRLVSALAIAALVAGCTPFTDGDCTTELGIDLRPRTQTVRPGESFTATFEFTSCGGRQRWRPEVVWRTADTTIVAVDSLRGRITGRAVGDAEVAVYEVRQGAVSPHEYGRVQVQVR